MFSLRESRAHFGRLFVRIANFMRIVHPAFRRVVWLMI